jgi:hypothetical protein
MPNCNDIFTEMLIYYDSRYFILLMAGHLENQIHNVFRHHSSPVKWLEYRRVNKVTN